MSSNCKHPLAPKTDIHWSQSAMIMSCSVRTYPLHSGLMLICFHVHLLSTDVPKKCFLAQLWVFMKLLTRHGERGSGRNARRKKPTHKSEDDPLSCSRNHQQLEQLQWLHQCWIKFDFPQASYSCRGLFNSPVSSALKPRSTALRICAGPANTGIRWHSVWCCCTVCHI